MTDIIPPPTEAEYEAARIEELESYAPETIPCPDCRLLFKFRILNGPLLIIPCPDCRWPVVDGYCCGHCGSPGGSNDLHYQYAMEIGRDVLKRLRGIKISLVEGRHAPFECEIHWSCENDGFFGVAAVVKEDCTISIGRKDVPAHDPNAVEKVLKHIRKERRNARQVARPIETEKHQ